MIISISGKIGSGKDTIGEIIQILTHNESFSNENVLEHLKIDAVKHYIGPVWEIKKFAGKLKQVVALLTGCTIGQLEDQEFKASNMSEKWSHPNGWADQPEKELVPVTYREFLQKVGTDALRDKVHKEVWVNALFADYSKYINQATGNQVLLEDYVYYKNGLDSKAEIVTKQEPNWIITDTRFPNELAAVEERGGITIKVDRPYTTVVGVSGIPATFSQTQFHSSETALDNSSFDYVILNNGTMEELIKEVRDILQKEKIIKY